MLFNYSRYNEIYKFAYFYKIQNYFFFHYVPIISFVIQFQVYYYHTIQYFFFLYNSKFCIIIEFQYKKLSWNS